MLSGRGVVVIFLICLFLLLSTGEDAAAAPTIIHHPAPSIEKGEDLVITVNISDESPVREVVLRYRHTGEDYREIKMDRIAGNDTAGTYQAALTGETGSLGYIFYSFNVTDGNGYTESEVYTTSVMDNGANESQLGIFIMAMVVAVIFIILEIGLKYRHI